MLCKKLLSCDIIPSIYHFISAFKEILPLAKIKAEFQNSIL